MNEWHHSFPDIPQSCIFSVNIQGVLINPHLGCVQGLHEGGGRGKLVLGREQNRMWEGEIKGARAISSIRDRVGMGLEHLCSSDEVGSR